MPTVLAVGALFLIGCTQASNTSTNNAASPAAAKPQNVSIAPPFDLMARGRDLYMTNCAACHKEDGRGGKMEIEERTFKPDDLASAKIRSFPDDKVITYIYNGVEEEGMPAFKDKLSEAEIREVVKYIRGEIQK
jgi:mono/diheme cytochrome c family protein